MQNKSMRFQLGGLWLLALTIALTLSIWPQSKASASTCHGTDLSFCDFSYQNHQGQSFDGANLTGANFTGANLTDASFTGATLSGATFFLANLSRVNLSDMNLSGFVLARVNLTGAQLKGVNLTGADLTSADLTRANLTSANLTGANLKSANFIGANLSFANLSWPQDLPYADATTIFFGARLDGWAIAVLRFLNLRGADLSKADIQNSDFDNADLTGANLSGVNFGYGPKNNVMLMGANLAGASLTGRWNGCTLNDADLTGADLRSQFSRCSFDRANMSHALVGQGLFLRNSSNTFIGTNFTGVSLKNFDLFSTNLSDANLTGVQARDLISTYYWYEGGLRLPPHYQFVQGFILGPNVDLSDANLAGLDLGRIDLSGANLTGANVGGASFLDAKIEDVVTGNLQGVPANLPPGWFFESKAFVRHFSKVSMPTLSGDFTVGSSVAAVTGAWDSGAVFGYQWLREGSPISGATTAIYVPAPSDVGREVSVQVTASLQGFSSVLKTSSAKRIALGSMRSATPALSGIAKVGKTLKVVTTAWAPGAAIKYQWLLDGKAIKGATKQTLKLGAKFKGHKISNKVAQTSIGYLSATTTSKTVKVG